MPIARREAFNKAFELVQTGLQSGSIKLSGSHTAEDGAKRHAKADAAYLNELFVALQEAFAKIED